MITDKQREDFLAREEALSKLMDNYSHTVSEWVTLAFFLWAKNNGWTYSESREQWFNGMVRLNHKQVFSMFLQSCQNVTHVEASENTSSTP